VVWLSEEEREARLTTIRGRAERLLGPGRELVVFEGNAPSDVRENTVLRGLLGAAKRQSVPAGCIWLGAPNSIKGPTEVVFHRQSGQHLVIVGQYEESALAMLGISLISLASQHPPGNARFVIVDSSPAGSPQRQFLESVGAGIAHKVVWVDFGTLRSAMTELAGELDERGDPERARTSPSVYVILHHLERFKELRFEDDFGISAGGKEDVLDPARALQRVLSEGASQGVHVLATCDTYGNATRCLGRKGVGEFGYRVLFQMSANDSANLVDAPTASALGLHRALLHNTQGGGMEIFRPYALPDAAWVEEAGRQLRRLAGEG
jgi:hypothetical protein